MFLCEIYLSYLFFIELQVFRFGNRTYFENEAKTFCRLPSELRNHVRIEELLGLPKQLESGAQQASVRNRAEP